MDIDAIAAAALAKKKALNKAKAESSDTKTLDVAAQHIESSGQSYGSSGDLVKSKAFSQDKPVVVPGKDRSAVIVDVRTIKEDHQIRTLVEENPEAYSDESIRRLASTIKGNNGGKIEQPISISMLDDGDYLREGKRRIMACTMLAEEMGDDNYFYQPARYREDQDNDDIDFIQFNANNQKEKISVQGTAKFLKLKLDAGIPQKELASKTGYSTSKVSRLLKIFEYPEEIQTMIWAGDLPYEGRTLNKALKEFKAQDSVHLSIDAATPQYQSADATHSAVIAIDSSNGNADVDTENKLVVPEQRAPKKAKEAQSKKEKMVKPVKAKPITLDESDVKKLYQLVKISLYLNNLDDSADDIDKTPDRKTLLDTIKNVDDLIEVLQESITIKASAKG